MPDEKTAQDFLQTNLEHLWEENKRFLNPQEYPVDLSKACWENKQQKIFEVAEDVKEMEERHE